MKTLIRFFVIILLGYGITSCDEIAFGDDFLGSEPDREGATLDTMFSSMVNSDKVLTTAYTKLPYPIHGSIRGGSRTLECFTDLNHTYSNNSYYTGTMNATSNGWSGGSNWTAVRYAWIYLENIDKVADMTKADKDVRKAEAQTIIALAYSEMLRNIGGLPWIDHSIEVTEAMEFPRQTFAQTVDSVVTLLDKAIPYLKWNQNSADDGRMTKAGAMALKLRVLLYAASPAFNSNTLWHSGADVYTCYTNEDRGRWNRAKEAGEEFMTELGKSGYYGLVKAEEEGNHESYSLAFRKGYYQRGTGESLISTRRGYNAESVHSGFFGERYYSGPTLNYVNMFSWADGSDFPANFNWASPSMAPFYDVDGKPTRDPRLYETVAVPGSYYYNGTLAPVYWGHDSYRQGSSTGFQMVKFILTEESDRADIGAHWPYLRLPEVLLSYAEAINESEGGPNNTAYDCINEIRERVGLSELPRGLNKEAFREALLKERILEFGQEEVRWYDLVRWNLSDVFKEKLYYLNSYVKTMEGSTPTAFTFKVGEIPDRYWRNTWDSKWYLLPLPQSEVDKNYGWTQNPGW